MGKTLGEQANLADFVFIVVMIARRGLMIQHPVYDGGQGRVFEKVNGSVLRQRELHAQH